MNIIIFGRGKMAKLIAQKCVERRINHTVTQELNLPRKGFEPKETIVVHVGSGQYLKRLIAECQQCGYILIQASSGQKLPDSVPIPVIDAPNLGLLILALFDVLPRLGKLAQGLGAEADVMESHQASKTSAPITAQKIAGYFGKSPESVLSLRDPMVQEQSLHVPHEYLDGHAYHFVKVAAGGIEMELSFKVHGRDPYFEGLVILAEKVLKLDAEGVLMPGIHPADQLLFNA